MVMLWVLLRMPLAAIIGIGTLVYGIIVVIKLAAVAFHYHACYPWDEARGKTIKKMIHGEPKP